MSDINEWWLQGRIGAISPLIPGRKTSFCKINIATTTRPNDRGEQQTEWHNVLLFRDLAERFVAQATIGQVVRLKGYVHSHKYVHEQRTRVDPQFIAFWYSFDLTAQHEPPRAAA